ncbi:MAG: hypothetical protein ACLQQM_00695 [Acidimicrobiales bacterium]
MGLWPRSASSSDRKSVAWIGIVAGSLVCISSTLLMPYFPVWAIAYIILGILVVYGLSVYGGEALT